MVYIIYLSDGNGFCKDCGNQATLEVKAWDVKSNRDVLKDAKQCGKCFLAWQTALLLKHAKGVAA